MTSAHVSVLTRDDDGFDSIAWAIEVHLIDKDDREYNFALLHGNEDAPDKIEFWRSSRPLYWAKPDYVWEIPNES